MGILPLRRLFRLDRRRPPGMYVVAARRIQALRACGVKNPDTTRLRSADYVRTHFRLRAGARHAPLDDGGPYIFLVAYARGAISAAVLFARGNYGACAVNVMTARILHTSYTTCVRIILLSSSYTTHTYIHTCINDIVNARRDGR